MPVTRVTFFDHIDEKPKSRKADGRIQEHAPTFRWCSVATCMVMRLRNSAIPDDFRKARPGSRGQTVATLRERVEAEPYWFHQIDLGDGVVTPGWSDPARDKLPYFRLPDDMTGLRVLDVGCAEGYFSFEAERRGASEVVALDFDSECIKRFQLCAEALGSKVTRPQVHSIYEWIQASWAHSIWSCSSDCSTTESTRFLG